VDRAGNPQGTGQQSVRESLLECDEGANKGKPGPCPDPAKKEALKQQVAGSVDKLNRIHGHPVRSLNRPAGGAWDDHHRRAVESRAEAILDSAAGAAVPHYLLTGEGTTALSAHVGQGLYIHGAGDAVVIETDVLAGAGAGKRALIKPDTPPELADYLIRRVAGLPVTKAQQTQYGALDPRTRAGRKAQGLRESLLEGFTGTVTDKLGRVRHYVDGKQVKGPSLEHGYSREEVHAMSPAQRKSLLGLVAGISPKGKTDEEIRDILSPPEKAPAAPLAPAAGAPAPESKLLPAQHKAALNDLLAAKQKGEAQGGFDPRGDLAHLPPPEKTAAVRSDVLAIVAEHTKRTTVGIAVNKLYDQLAQKHDLSPEEFRAVLLDASRAGVVRPGLWPRMISDLPRPDLAPLISAEVVGHVHLPSG
jgi:hypothetical protein